METAPAFLAVGGNVLLTTSIVRSDTPLGNFRIGVQRNDGTPVVCQTDLGYGGPGSLALQTCGQALAGGGTADLLVTGAPPSALTWLVVGPTLNPTPAPRRPGRPRPRNGPLPLHRRPLRPAPAPEPLGRRRAADALRQTVVVDGGLPAGFAISNALQVDFLP